MSIALGRGPLRARRRLTLTRAMIDDAVGKHLAYDSTRARTELGATFRPADAVLRDAFRWLLSVGRSSRRSPRGCARRSAPLPFPTPAGRRSEVGPPGFEPGTNRL